MSSIQNDQELLQEGREKIEGVTVPLRDQIDKKLLAKLQEEKFGLKVAEIWAAANSERAERLKRREDFLADWDNFVEVDPQGSFEGTSNLHLPVTFTVVKTYHARILQALLANLPAPKARRPDSIEREKTIEELMKYTIKDWANEYEGIESVLDSWVFEWCAYGAGTLKSRWERKFERFVDVVNVPDVETEFVVDEQGNERAVQRPVMKEEEQERVLVTFAGPQTDFIPEEDFVVVGGDGCPQKADLVMHKQWLTASDLWSYVDQGIFDEKATKKIVYSGDNSQSSSLEGQIKLQKATQAGEQGVDSQTDLDRYEIIECYTGYDVTGTGVNSQIVAWVHPETGEIVRATFLRRMNKTGKRPFFTAEFHRRPGAKHPMGLIEVLYPVAREMDALHNMRIDAGIIASMPFGFYRASSSLNPETIKYEPGSLIPVDNPQTDVYFPQLGNRTAFGMQEEAGLMTMVERLTGISDLSLGAMSGVQGATRTATGVRGLIGEANANLDVHLKRLFRAWRQYLKHLLSLLQQRMPPGLSFRVTGDDGKDYWRWIKDQDDIAGDFDFEIDPSSADSNPQVRKEKALSTFNMVLNPMLIQLGVVTPLNIFEAAKGVLMADGIKEWARYLQKPPMDQMLLTPEEEVNRVVRGIPVPVSMNADHQGFLEYWAYIMKTPEMLGMFSQDGVRALAAQAQKHQQMLQAIEQMQAQAQNLSQMRMNAANSQQQAPTAMNPMTQAPLSAGA